ncbi:glycosyltransferase family 4 protein [Deferrisoma camini]|uniref:glycosyltransferase family 4 protein n=1 Tax=Deferrisoma camini TaxID=1035120 RepID=UPI00046CF824|nr:glycosyltransferase family 4 protein [Deferrisoma camini]
MRKLQIALLHYSCPPVVGGVEEVVRQQASLFRRHLHPVKIVAGAGGPFTDEFPVEINPKLGSRYERVARAQEPGQEDPRTLDRITGEIHAYLAETLAGFDVVVAHNVLAMAYNLPLARALHRLADEGRIRVVAWNHDSPFFYDHMAPRLGHPVWEILRTHNPNVVYVTITEARRRQFEDLYGRGARVHVVPNGIDPIRFFRLDPTTVRVIQEQRLFEAEFLLVHPSRLHPRKNIELSIRVVRALQDEGLGARLLLTGAYDPHEEKTLAYYRRLRALARELGVLDDILVMAEYRFRSGERLSADRITIRDLYLLADVLFMPSIQEGFGIPLLEAGMIKLPIVCSDIPPFREIGGQNVTYFGLDETPVEIARKVLAVARDPNTQSMFRHVIRHYVWDNLYTRQILPLLQEAASG